MLRLEGSLLTPDAVKQGTYSLVIIGSLVWRANPTAEAQAFLDFATNPAGRSVAANGVCRAVIAWR